jgi:hypothetical protein
VCVTRCRHLVSRNTHDYEEVLLRVVRTARDRPPWASALAGVGGSDLFDAGAYVREFERAFRLMIEMRAAGVRLMHLVTSASQRRSNSAEAAAARGAPPSQPKHARAAAPRAPAKAVHRATLLHPQETPTFGVEVN